jgi:TolB protein
MSWQQLRSRLVALGLLLLAWRTVAVSAMEPLTQDGHFKQDPVFVDGTGSQLIYTVQARPEQLRLMRLRLDDGLSLPLFPEQTRSEFEPAVSRDGRFLSFVQSRGNLSLALVIRNQESNEQAELPPDGGFSGFRSPCFSADGQRVLYSFPTGGRQQIFSITRSAAERQVVVDSPGINNWPDVSPDGQHLLFASTRDGDFEIYVAASDGSQAQRLTHSAGQDIRPRFSPDGRHIAFTSNRDGNYEIYVMDRHGRQLQRITEHPERDDYAAWHPAGRQLVFVAERDGRFDLYLSPVSLAAPAEE